MENIVIIAHDAKKPDMVKFLDEHKDWLPEVYLIATGRTAEFVEKEGVQVRHLKPGQYGGYNEITRMISKHEVDMVIFFIDPTVKEIYHEDIQRLLDTCNAHNIPLTTNPATAELVILGLIRKKVADKSRKIFSAE